MVENIVRRGLVGWVVVASLGLVACSSGGGSGAGASGQGGTSGFLGGGGKVGDDDDDDDDLAGNGGKPGSGGKSGSGGKAGSTSGGNFSCCLNGVTYACPGKAAFDDCVGFDVGGCIEACDPADFMCPDECFQKAANTEPDPSGCQEESDTGTGTCPGTGGSCEGTLEGVACDIDSDCKSLNCFKGQCYGSEVGNPCDIDSDCKSLNCYESCCYDTGKGEPCDIDSDCKSLVCTNHECQ